MIGWGAAAVFALVAVGAGVAAKVAFEQRAAAERETQRADRNFTAAKQTVDGLIFNIAQGLRDVAGMRVDTIRKILDTVQTTIDQLTLTAPDDPQLLHSRAVMFTNFVDTYLAAGDLRDAAAAAAQSLDIDRKRAAQDQGNAEAQTDLVVSLYKVSTVVDPPQARTALAEALSILEKLGQEQKLTAAQMDWPNMIRTALSKLP
jgi:hypothetical protein